MTRFFINVAELIGIVFLRFRLVPRVWCVWLVGINAAAIGFISHIEAQVLLLVTLLAVIVQALIYDRIRFTRILGIAHLMWVPLFAWIATRLDLIEPNSAFAYWLAAVAITNAVSLIVDLIDVTRFALGERRPHYQWNNQSAP